MSIADLLSRATPEARYYDYDRKIMEDYDNRINIYNDALKQYQSDYDVYKGKVDAHNELANAYNTRLQDYTKQAEDYNAAVQKYLERYQGGQGGPSFKDSGFYVEKPGEFNESAPIFKGGDEPTAPTDPGFKKQDVDAFIDEATARATRRGQTAATAFNVLSQGGNFATAPQVQGGAGVGTTPEFSFSATGFADGGAAFPPADNPVRNEGAIGLGYYIPPELRQFGRNVMSFARAVDPVQGIMRGMRATGRAFDSDLPSEERKAAAVEAALETLAPVGMMGMGALAKQPIKATLMDVLTPTGAPASMTDEAVEAVSDPSRRAFMKGAAATGGIAALAPDLAMEAMNRVPAAVTKTAAKAATINPINMAIENIRLLKKQTDEALDIRDEAREQLSEFRNRMLPKQDASTQDFKKFDSDPNVKNLTEQSKNANDTIVYNFQEQTDLLNEVLNEIDPKFFNSASDDSLEELASVQYDAVYGFDDAINKVGKNFETLVKEIQRRGMHTAKDQNGIDRFPYARTFIEDYNDEIAQNVLDLSLPNTALKMTDEDAAKSTQQLIDELQIRVMREELRDVTAAMKNRGASQQAIENYIRRKRGDIFEAEGLPRDMDDFYADGGVVSFAPYLR